MSDALVESLSEDAVAELARRLAPYLPQPQPAGEDAWLSTRDAAEYLGLSLNALHKLTAARAIPFSQDAPGGKYWFLRSELAEWRCNGG